MQLLKGETDCAQCQPSIRLVIWSRRLSLTHPLHAGEHSCPTSTKRWRQSLSWAGAPSFRVGRPPGGMALELFLEDRRAERLVLPRPMVYCDRLRSDISSCAAGTQD